MPLFTETVINGMVLRNRLVRSATWEGMCETDGRPTARLAECYRNLARGGVGLIITGYTFVRPDGRQMPGMMGIHGDDFAAEMRALTGAVHAEGGKLCLQLVHAGGQTDSGNAGVRPLAPSAIKVEQFPEQPRAMTFADIQSLVKAFREAARRGKEYGFDAVQLHAAHGYLINQFLSPHTNYRADEYGGSLENRSRFLMEVYWAVREAVGRNYPVLVKLTGADNLAGGLDLEDARRVAHQLDQAGVDALEISAGTPASGPGAPIRRHIDQPGDEAYNLPLSGAIKAGVSCPIMVVGGFRSLEVCEAALQHDADYISMARPFIREPDLVIRWRSGNRARATCTSCNGCFIPAFKEGGIYCVVEKKAQT
ncbi:MAG TPA: NADH:flavin oxidoreductase [Desulfurivibrionaceae bacterium]|nr:NADH:flavin oxidoreductase [Desulfurivibrionaceae bacterium]